jgi:hypothetical protein
MKQKDGRMSQGYGNAFSPAALGYNNPNRQHIVSRASLLSPRNLNPQQAKELYLASVANSRRIRTPMNGGNAHDFWDAYVARQNAHMIALQANPCYVSSPRPHLSPRFDLSPRNLVAAAPHFRRQMPSGSTLPPIGRMSPRIQTAAATPTRAPRQSAGWPPTRSANTRDSCTAGAQSAPP